MIGIGASERQHKHSVKHFYYLLKKKLRISLPMDRVTLISEMEMKSLSPLKKFISY